MTRFSESIRESSAAVLERMRSHKLVTMIAEGRLTGDRIRFLLGQMSLLAREHERFISCLIAKAPHEIRRSLLEAGMNFYWDSDLFAELILRGGVDPSRQRMSFACRSSADFLFTAVTVQTYAEAICAGYGTADSAREFWTQVRPVQPEGFEWAGVVDMMSRNTMASWISAMAKAVDGVATNSPPALQERMFESYSRAIHYEIRLLDLGLEDEAP